MNCSGVWLSTLFNLRTTKILFPNHATRNCNFDSEKLKAKQSWHYERNDGELPAYRNIRHDFISEYRLLVVWWRLPLRRGKIATNVYCLPRSCFGLKKIFTAHSNRAVLTTFIGNRFLYIWKLISRWFYRFDRLPAYHGQNFI